MEETLRVTESLAGKNLFITGVSGFLGKALLEKILRSVSGVGQITLLLRPSSSYSSADERFWQEIYPSSVFDRLRSEQGDEAFKFFCSEKIRCVTGEITQSRFGLEKDEYERLARTTDLFINSAASVNFREALDQALQINTLCLMHVVDFLAAAGRIPLVHVSTCYVHGYHRGSLAETSISAFDEEAVCEFANTLDEQTLVDRMHGAIFTRRDKAKSPEEREQALIDLGIELANRFGWNDTYTFTKWLGEQLLLRHLSPDQLSIVRPAIIESALSEPVPGWIEGVKVADALTLAYARRRFSLFPVRRKGVLDVVPVDRVVNAVILASAEQITNTAGDQIYQVGSSAQAPVTLGEYIDIVVTELGSHWQRYPRLTGGRQPGQGLKSVHRSAFLAAMQSQRALLRAAQKLSPNDEKLAEKLKSVDVTLKLATIYSFYTNPAYTFENTNTLKLSQRFSNRDQECFPVSCAGLDWHEYLCEIHLPGLEQYGLASS